MELKKYFTDEEVVKVGGILIPFYDKLFLDKKIFNPEAIVLCTYMISNELKKSEVDIDKVKELFINMGRSSREFSKALYEISGGRQKVKQFISKKGGYLGLTYDGLIKIKEIMGNKNG